MKALIQRVMNAKVSVNGEVISSIEQGLCVFIGICNNDSEKEMEHIARKILNIKVFADETSKKWRLSVVEKQLEVLCISQFTLYNTWKGNRPDFHNAMPGDKSKQFYEKFLVLLKNQYKPEKIKDGKFGEYMQVSLQNDGPVTFEIEFPIKGFGKDMDSTSIRSKSKGDINQSGQYTKANQDGSIMTTVL